jgi:hypothetical protein
VMSESGKLGLREASVRVEPLGLRLSRACRDSEALVVKGIFVGSVHS